MARPAKDIYPLWTMEGIGGRSTGRISGHEGGSDQSRVSRLMRIVWLNRSAG